MVGPKCDIDELVADTTEQLETLPRSNGLLSVGAFSKMFLGRRQGVGSLQAGREKAYKI